MAKRSAKMEIRKEISEFDVTMEMMLFKQKLEKEQQKRSTSKAKVAARKRHSKETVETPHTKEIPKRVYLYLQLQSIKNVPQNMEKITIKLQHKNENIAKLDDHHGPSVEIDPYATEEYKPTFSITVEQDSLDDMNSYSDNPLLITIYQHHNVNVTGEEVGAEDEAEMQETLEPIAQGYIDLLQFFTRKRSITTMDTFLYPISLHNMSFYTGTCKTTWQIYTLLPLLKDISFCNMVFITFESIYNATSELLDASSELAVDVSFQSKLLNEKGKFDVIHICNFLRFKKSVIAEQDPNQKWETIIQNSPMPVDNLTAQSGCRITTEKLMSDLLCDEDVELNYKEISFKDFALVSNSMRRYILTEELVNILQDVVAFNEQQLLIEVYKRDAPEKKLLRGTIDLSIFLYPQVNACRFAVPLVPVPEDTKPISKGKRKTPVADNRIKNKSPKQSIPYTPLPKTKPIFAIVNICLLSPITDSPEKLSLHIGRQLDPEQLKTCKAIVPDAICKATSRVCQETYNSFDEQIRAITEYIVRKEIKSFDEGKQILCCHLENLSNKIMKLIACDFNVKYPTKNNVEFSNLMSIVYHQLVERVHKILYSCNNENLQKCNTANWEAQNKILEFMSSIKVLFEVGDTKMANFFIEKLKKLDQNHTSLNFFSFLYNVEKRNFKKAKEYLERPLNEKYMPGEYFALLISIYINYSLIREGEESFNQALQYLLRALEDFIALYPLEIAVWILLHCLYKSCGYLPGMSFTRWKYDNLPNNLHRPLPDLPLSLWDMYNNYNLNLETSKGAKYLKVMQLFLQLGLYRFALIIYENIAYEFTEPEKYFMTTTFKMLLDEMPATYPAKTFATEKMLNAYNIKLYQAHINGNLEYFRGNTELAMHNYEHLVNVPFFDMENFLISLMRYGYHMTEIGHYENATTAFQRCCLVQANSFVQHYCIGKAMYRLNRFSDAELYFAKCTTYKMHMPDVWAYLALVNIKMGHEFKALESWKYAKLHPENEISEEILMEFEKLNCNDLKLYVEKPSAKIGLHIV